MNPINLIPKAVVLLVLIKKIGDFISGKFRGRDAPVTPQDVNWALFDAVEDSMTMVRKLGDLRLWRGGKGSSKKLVGFSKIAGEDDWKQPGKTPLYVTATMQIVVRWDAFEKALADRTDEYLADLVADAFSDRDVRKQLLRSITAEEAEDVFQSLIQQQYHRGQMGKVLDRKVMEFLREQTGKDDFEIRLNPPKVNPDRSKVTKETIIIGFDLKWNVRYRGFWRP